MRKKIPYYFRSIKAGIKLSGVGFYLIVLLASLQLLSCKLESKKEGSHVDTTKVLSIAKPVVIELITDSGKAVDTKQLATIIGAFKISATNIYQWKNHAAIFDTVTNVGQLDSAIVANMPALKVKLYETPFYHFNRAHCDSTGMAKQWDNIVLTANLVKDTVLQNEYLNYHATQFKKWPEVSNGFCHAHFQQLLVFKNGRQLMLVISIPKGESLDKLNPKTTENNPRVNDWNNLMKKYQEGIEGTIKGETWVFLKPAF